MYRSLAETKPVKRRDEKCDFYVLLRGNCYLSVGNHSGDYFGWSPRKLCVDSKPPGYLGFEILARVHVVIIQLPNRISRLQPTSERRIILPMVLLW